MSAIPQPNASRWQRFSAASVRAFHAYAGWLAARDAGSEPRASDDGTARRASRRTQRQAGARAREAMKPLTDRVREIEREMNRVRAELEALERQLADSSLYADQSRRAALAEAARSQATARSRLSALEDDMQRSKLARPGAFALAHNVGSQNEVQPLLDRLAAAGGRMLRTGDAPPHGGFRGYVADPDDHAWEIAWNPAWPISPEGYVRFAGPGG